MELVASTAHKTSSTCSASCWISCGADRRKESAVLTWAGKNWMARIGPRGRALDVVRAHIAAEVDTRTDVIMSTVSADPWFPLPDRLPTGLTLTVVQGTDDVTTFYADRR